MTGFSTQIDLYRYERDLYQRGIHFPAGLDEAGRGPLAGPVVAAAVILPEACEILGLNDSKKLAEKKRLVLEPIIKERAIAWALGAVSAKVIDRINILEASKLAMERAVRNLGITPEFLLLDGNFYIHSDLEQKPIIKGDSLSASIAAASILAKCHRDRLMLYYHQRYPQYGFDRHKGYPTVFHRQVLRELGRCPIHRLTFRAD